MSLIDFILNVAGILLWLNWRSAPADPFLRGMPATLSGTVRRAQPLRMKRWHSLVALAVLVILRSFFYWFIGPEVNWAPRLDLYFVVLTFGFGDAFSWIPLLFSILSFLRAFLVFYFWLTVLAAVNARETRPDSMQKMIVLQLGVVARWPRAAQLFLVPLLAAALWGAFHPALVHADAVSRVRTIWILAGQGLLVALAAVLSLKCLLLAVLGVHFVASYVYFGRNPFWDFVGATAQNLLTQWKLAGLRIGKLDFAPIAGMALVFVVLVLAPWFAQVLADHYGRTLWPQ